MYVEVGIFENYFILLLFKFVKYSVYVVNV